MADKISNLKNYIKACGKVVMAYSGGVDSSVMLKLCSDILGSDNVVAATGVSEIYTDLELEASANFAKSIGVEHVVLRTAGIENPDFRSNSPLRCYHCKKDFFSKLVVLAGERGIKYIFDGSNKDDFADYRPGRKAAVESGVVSPLAKYDFTKSEVREVAKEIGVVFWNRPSNSCLASRIPYGDEITKEKLEMVYESEKFLKDKGFENVRVRHHGKLAKIEVPEQDITKLFKEPVKKEIIRKLKEIGFTWVSVDMKEYRTGSLNEIL